MKNNGVMVSDRTVPKYQSGHGMIPFSPVGTYAKKRSSLLRQAAWGLSKSQHDRHNGGTMMLLCVHCAHIHSTMDGLIRGQSEQRPDNQTKGAFNGFTNNQFNSSRQRRKWRQHINRRTHFDWSISK
eukprot:scaffold136067_cov34-Prasinocladus_malaysianus.AAC.1